MGLEDEVVLVKTSLTSSRVQQMLEGTGKLVVFRGYGGTGPPQGNLYCSVYTRAPDSPPHPPLALPSTHHGAAVVILNAGGVKGGGLRGEGVKGLARLVQTSPDQCVIEGTIDGLGPGARHAVCVHQYGDLSDGLRR